MREQLAALYELQSLDVTVTGIRRKLASIRGAQALKTQLAQAKAALDAAEKALTSHETDLTDAELKLKSVDEKRGVFEKRLYGGAVTNPKELGAIEKEIAMLKSQQSQFDGRTLDLYDLVEKARGEAREARETVADIEKQIKVRLERESEAKTKLEAELDQTTSQREAVAPKVTDKALLARYETVRKKTGDTGIAKVVNGQCEGCRISITPFDARKLHEDKDYISCESCGRVLYLDSSNE